MPLLLCLVFLTPRFPFHLRDMYYARRSQRRIPKEAEFGRPQGGKGIMCIDRRAAHSAPAEDLDVVMIGGIFGAKYLDSSKWQSATLAEVGLVREFGVKRCPV